MKQIELNLDDPRVAINFLRKEMGKINRAKFALADRIIGDDDPSDRSVQALLIPEWVAKQEDMCTLLIHLAVNRNVAMSSIDKNVKCRAKTSRNVERAIRALQRTDDDRRLLDSLRVTNPALAA